MSFRSFRAIHADVLKGMISYRNGFSECAHRRASYGQHAWKLLFNDSCPACQEQNSHQFTDRPDTQFSFRISKFFDGSVTPATPASSWPQEVLMRRQLAAILAIPMLLNGLAMLVAGPLWYETVPGVPDTGPFNPHFVQDIGAAFLVAGLALAARAWRPRYWPAAVAGAGFLAAHGLIHLVLIVSGHAHHAAFDLLAVVLPSALALYSAFPNQGEQHA
ncbi:hypothetical protein [Bradyrhizobium retamae]|nr:hypothetical protein [Bradyrhizobium retamae]